MSGASNAIPYSMSYQVNFGYYNCIQLIVAPRLRLFCQCTPDPNSAPACACTIGSWSDAVLLAIEADDDLLLARR